MDRDPFFAQRPENETTATALTELNSFSLTATDATSSSKDSILRYVLHIIEELIRGLKKSIFGLT